MSALRTPRIKRVPLAAHVATRATATAVADVLKLDFDPVRGVNKDFDGRAAQSLPRADAKLRKPLHDLIRSERLDAESDVRPKGGRTASLDQCDELRPGANPKDRNRRHGLPQCQSLHVSEFQIPINRALDTWHDQRDVVQRSDQNRWRAARQRGRLRRCVAHVTQETASAARVGRIELKREAVALVEVDAIDGFSFTKYRLSRRMHLGESS